ncbi:MAG TPA: hypothetical protein VKE40_02665 [Gemmataceae bacterium]|nr:hypothetical protein [Gemmataceae bacterium]
MGQPVPWYKRNILPAWLPGWLAACLLIAVGFAVMFGIFLEDPHPLEITAKAGFAGFLIGLVTLSVAATRYRGHQPNPFAPPAAVRYPAITGLIALVPFIWVWDREITTGPSRGGRVLVAGTGAEVLGLIVLLAIAAGLVGAIAAVRRRPGTARLPLVLSLVLAAGVFACGLIHVIIRHAS